MNIIDSVYNIRIWLFGFITSLQLIPPFTNVKIIPAFKNDTWDYYLYWYLWRFGLNSMIPNTREDSIIKYRNDRYILFNDINLINIFNTDYTTLKRFRPPILSIKIDGNELVSEFKREIINFIKNSDNMTFIHLRLYYDLPGNDITVKFITKEKTYSLKSCERLNVIYE